MLLHASTVPHVRLALDTYGECDLDGGDFSVRLKLVRLFRDVRDWRIEPAVAAFDFLGLEAIGCCL
eukprot:scaffold20268_cov64-Cyclotella_meneghiniana.AAC.4